MLEGFDLELRDRCTNKVCNDAVVLCRKDYLPDFCDLHNNREARKTCVFVLFYVCVLLFLANHT